MQVFKIVGELLENDEDRNQDWLEAYRNRLASHILLNSSMYKNF